MIDKTTFCAVIENIRQQMYLDRKNGEIIQEMFGCSSRCTYNDNLLVQSIMMLLHYHFPKDKDGYCPIEFYCFELEFQKIDGESISNEELYDLLIKQRKIKQTN